MTEKGRDQASDATWEKGRSVHCGAAAGGLQWGCAGVAAEGLERARPANLLAEVCERRPG